MHWVCFHEDLKEVLEVMTEVITNIGDTINRIVKLSSKENGKFLMIEGVRGSSYIKQFVTLLNSEEVKERVYYIDLFDLVNLVNHLDTNEVIFNTTEDEFKVAYMDGFYYFDLFDLDNEYSGVQMDLGVSTRGYSKIGSYGAGALPYQKLLKVMGIAEKAKSRSLSIIEDNAYISFGFMFLRVKNIAFASLRLSHQMLKTLEILNRESKVEVWVKGEEDDPESFVLFRWGADTRNFVIFGKEDLEDETKAMMDKSLAKVDFFEVDIEKVQKLVAVFAPQSDNISRIQFKKTRNSLYMHTFSRRGMESKFKVSGEAGCDVPIDFGINIFILGKIINAGGEKLSIMNEDDTRFFKVGNDIELIL